MKTRKITIPAYGTNIVAEASMDISTQCLNCIYLNNDLMTCKAFENGIPDEIFSGNFDHTEPFKGDNGIQFEEIK